MQSSSESGQYGVPPAPPVPAAAAPVRQPVDSALRLVLVLMFANLGLSVLTTILTLILSKSVVDYEIGHMPMASDLSQTDLDIERQALQSALWYRVFGSVLISAVYVWRAFALRRGARGAYIRLYYIGIIGLVGIVYLIAVARYYPLWMRAEQVLQAAVLVGLLIAVSRKEVRNRFAKRPKFG